VIGRASIPSQDIFDGAAERLISTAGFLKREEVRSQCCSVPFPDSGAILRAAFAHPLPPQTLVLCESVTSVEQAFKVLDLIVKHLENKAVIGGEIDDCECRIGDHVLANHLSFIHALIDCLRVLIGLK